MNEQQKRELTELLLRRVMDECAIYDGESLFDDMLDEIYGFESVGGPFEYMTPSAVLKTCDPIAYRCGISDYMDSHSDRFVEVHNGYVLREDAESVCDAMISDFEAEIEELRTERMRAINQTGGDQPDLDDQIAHLEESIDVLSHYNF